MAMVEGEAPASLTNGALRSEEEEEEEEEEEGEGDVILCHKHQGKTRLVHHTTTRAIAHT